MVLWIQINKNSVEMIDKCNDSLTFIYLFLWLILGKLFSDPSIVVIVIVGSSE